MDETDGGRWPELAIPSPVMATRGQAIRKARLLRKLTIPELAGQLGIGARTLGRIERDEATSDSRTIDLVEAHLGLTEETPVRTTSPRLAEATHAELAVEVYRRLMKLSAAEVVDGPLPDEAVADPDAISDPDARPDPGQARHPKESDG